MTPGPNPDDPWLALGAASRLVGVAPDTLRRWADTGRVESFVTPGGHRRFLRSSLEAMMNAPRRHRYGVERLTGSAGTISGDVHRRMTRSGLTAPPWQARLSAAQRADFRRWGQRTFSLVLEYAAAGKRAERALLLGEAEKMGALYGAEASKAGLSLAEAVEAFLYYRTPVLEAIGSHLRRRAAELSDLTSAYREATAAIDGVLTALVGSYRDGAG
ncbi:MAG TPA: helix-turn-helix domain-containing protein [Candidatus Limnocylindria bacterium]|nr:helix-turn-helix domain-containing protein [Candidatus Limnocylindria bacterium]